MSSTAELRALEERVEHLEEELRELRAPRKRRRTKVPVLAPEDVPSPSALSQARRMCRDFGLRRVSKR